MDASSFVGALLGIIFVGIVPLKKPVLKLSLFGLLFIFAMEILYISRFTIVLRPFLLMSSRLCCGFFRSYSFVSFIVLNVYFQNDEHKPLLQIWYALKMLGEILGVVLP